jgi:hypothetical protein
MSHSSMLTTRRRNQSRKKQLYRAAKQARRKAFAQKPKGSPGEQKA